MDGVFSWYFPLMRPTKHVCVQTKEIPFGFLHASDHVYMDIT